MVIVEELGASTVNIRVYFWINSHEHSAIKVRSSVIRLTKLAFESAGLTLPDESREVIFPRGVPVLMHHAENDTTLVARDQEQLVPEKTSTRPEKIANAAEDDLSSEDEVINAQARQARSPEEGENLLEE